MRRRQFRPTETKKESDPRLDNVPVRDTAALLVPTTAIIVTQNPRTDLGELTELKNSIADRGILNPLLVVKTAGGIELLGGHRRLHCAKELGLATVPCRIVETAEPDVVKLLDNIMREDISPEDLCLCLKRLLVAFDGNKSALARAISKSPSYVNRAVKAAELNESGMFAREQRKLSLRSLFELAMADNPQEALAAATDATGDAIREAKAEVPTSTRSPKRKQSGALPGGRAVAKAIQFHERKNGAAFSLRINFDEEKTAPETRADIVRRLEEVLRRLKGER